MVLVAISGVIGVYHAGVEWHVWAGPPACTGPAFKLPGALDLNARVVMCDVAAVAALRNLAWRAIMP